MALETIEEASRIGKFMAHPMSPQNLKLHSDRVRMSCVKDQKVCSEWRVYKKKNCVDTQKS